MINLVDYRYHRKTIYLVNCFAKHPSDKLKELQVIVLHERCGRRIEPVFAGSSEQVQGRIKHSLYCLFQELLEDSILIDSGLGQTLLVYETYSNYAFQRL